MSSQKRWKVTEDQFDFLIDTIPSYDQGGYPYVSGKAGMVREIITAIDPDLGAALAEAMDEKYWDLSPKNYGVDGFNRRVYDVYNQTSETEKTKRSLLEAIAKFKKERSDAGRNLISSEEFARKTAAVALCDQKIADLNSQLEILNSSTQLSTE